MLRIGICDDDIGARDSLRLMIGRLLRIYSGKTFYDFSSGEGTVRWLEKHPGELDLLFLDIELGGISGMETAQRIRKADSNLMLVFVTGYSDFVFDGYSVGALDYLVKPIEENKLKNVLTRAQMLLETRKPQTFVIRNSDGIYRIDKKDILYLKSDRRIIKLSTKKCEYDYYGKLDEAQSDLGTGFVRIHQRYLVSSNAVSKVGKDFVDVGSIRLPISRSLRKKAVTALAHDMIKAGNRF